MTFILPGTPAPKKDPYANADRAFQEAQEARHARKQSDKALSWEKAVKQVKVWTPSMAVEAMTRMPSGMQQQYCLAEEATLNRTEVLRFFPTPGPTARAAWAGFAVPATKKRAAK